MIAVKLWAQIFSKWFTFCLNIFHRSLNLPFLFVLLGNVRNIQDRSATAITLVLGFIYQFLLVQTEVFFFIILYYSLEILYNSLEIKMELNYKLPSSLPPWHFFTFAVPWLYIFLFILLMKHSTSEAACVCLSLVKRILKLKRFEVTMKNICICDASGYWR